jgi:hypothetical protein
MFEDDQEVAELEVQDASGALDAFDDALTYLQSIYRDPTQPEARRMRAAMAALPFETPKLGAVAVTSLTANDFAAALDRAIARSGKAPLLIEARAERSEQVEPEQRWREAEQVQD